MKDPRMLEAQPSSSEKQNGYTNNINNRHLKRKRDSTSPNMQKNFTRIPLPIDKVELQVIEVLKNNLTSIIIGETGSGKSTQIPQLCMRAGFSSEGIIAVTQPRRVAAISLANRVSTELQTTLGETVGYHVRFENMVSESTKVCYMTDGMLLREAIEDPLLHKYSVIIIDEAHERSLHTDVLLSVIKTLRKSTGRKEPLRVVVMSATMQADLFSNYFDSAPVYVIQGRTFEVDLYHAVAIDPKNSDYVYNALLCLKDVHFNRDISDDVLVFLTGMEEIQIAVKKVKELNKELSNKLFPLPLYAAMTQLAQMKVFKPAPAGERKVIFATNIAETSITIPGIRVVIDSGKVKMRTFTASDRIDVLRVQDISKAQAIQRAGRAGREAPGVCYRLFPESHFNSLAETTVPEILRSNLSGVFLELMVMGLKRPEKLKLVQNPEESLINAAIKELLALNAIKQTYKYDKKLGPSYVLTDEGDILSKFPLSPELAKVVLCASELGCLVEVLWIIAALSVDSIFQIDENASKEEAAKARERFRTNEGDHLTILQICLCFSREMKKGNDKSWCADNFLNFKALRNVVKIKKQIMEICRRYKLNIKSCGANRDKLRQALATGLFMNVCEYVPKEGKYRMICQPRTMLKIHPLSAVARSNPRHIVFTELIRTTDLYAQSVTLIDYEWVRTTCERYAKDMRK